MSAIYDYIGNQIVPVNELDGLDDLRSDRLLIWHDEFKDGLIDKTKWDNLYAYADTRGTFIYPEDINRNIRVGSGLDYFSLKDNPYSNAVRSCPYLHTHGKFEFRYGLIEAKIKFSTEGIYHSTLWTLGANHIKKCFGEDQAWETVGMNFPSCGEIDIAECDNKTVTCGTHYSNAIDGTTKVSSSHPTIVSNGSTDYHIYGCEWTDTQIKIYVDRVLEFTWDISNAELTNYNPFKLPHYLIMNCVPTLSTVPSWDEMHTLVDWVRVYAPVGVTEFINETAIALNLSSVSVAVGGKEFLTCSFIPSNPSDQTIIWQSMNENICTCYGGKVVGVASGVTFVKATSKHGYVALCKVTVS